MAHAKAKVWPCLSCEGFGIAAERDGVNLEASESAVFLKMSQRKPYFGLDPLLCAEFARQRSANSQNVHKLS